MGPAATCFPVLPRLWRRPMYLHEQLPIPWRAIRALERARLALPIGSRRPLPPPAGGMSGAVTIAALGDVWLKPSPPGGPARDLAGLHDALARADLACCNLEAPLTDAELPAAPLGGRIRGAPETAQLLGRAGIAVANVAGNHALDGGQAGLAASLERLAGAGVAACGLADDSGAARLVVREVRGLAIGFLGYCDDHAPVATGEAGPAPALAWPERMTAEVAAAAAEVDVLVVQLHWGYEFRCHPLRRHRDLARRLVALGARLVFCHHAHVPMGVELWGEGLVAYGLGNAAFPITAYLREGHPWTDRAFLLEVELVRGGVTGARIVPFGIDGGGLPRLLPAGEAARLRRAVEIASARLADEEFMAASDEAQLVYDGVGLLAALRAARDGGPEALAARVATLRLPRQRALVAALAAGTGTQALASAIDGLARAGDDGEDASRRLDALAPVLSAGHDALRRRFRFGPALATRVP